MLLQYAREHHFPNPTFFVDDGVSGVTYDRPGFQAMLAEIEAGRGAVAIAKDLSRLGRNSALTGLYTNFTFPQNGVRFIAINDNYDTIDPNRVDNDFAGIKNWFNEFYARDTSRKIRAVQKAKGERGVDGAALDGLDHAAALLGAVVIGDDGNNAVIQAEYGHEHKAVELEVDAEGCGGGLPGGVIGDEDLFP